MTCTLPTAFYDPTDPIMVSELLAKAFPCPWRTECLLSPRQLIRLTSEKGKPLTLWQLHHYSLAELIQSKDILIHK